jgi:hypothetical protein
VVEVLQWHLVKVKAIVEFRKLKDDINHFWLVGTIEAAMLSPIENALAALVDQVWANWVHSVVSRGVPLLLLGQQQHRAVVLGLACVALLNGVSDVAPNVRSVVPIQENNCLVLLREQLRARLANRFPLRLHVLRVV